MQPEHYDAWYASRRGAWIGGIECRLLEALLAPRGGETLLDVGCGTGYFTRRLAQAMHAGFATGTDIDCASVRYAARHDPGAAYALADARRLPFADKSFDLVVSVTALCFVEEAQTALSEMLRVARRRVALGLLNRHSLLWLEKGRHGGHGAYRGARWHTPADVRNLFSGYPVREVSLRTAVMLPGGGVVARALEGSLRRLAPACGAFIAAAADVR
ncbi:methyltransferase domain-containing protein [Aromatoleum evansii]|uniref:methyltransferase domain-containing protein n=1 Tax=Aromatoleum evansii TaxID=59406 RepID=UPI00145E45D1|nr:methyltransferase domain-containing protein [Aromatoleum evansii]